MDRLTLIQKLLREHTATSSATLNYFENPRKYAEDDSLYMREVHFVVEVGSMENPTMSEMAARLNVTQGAVTQMATRLEKKGYVLRSKDTQDKRVTTITLTEKGRILCREHVAFDRGVHMEFSEKLKEFSEAELERLIHYETLMREMFTNHP